MARILLLRHGQSAWNAEGRWQGWADPPLTTPGELAAEAAGRALADAGLRAVISSDLRRARCTAEIVAGVLGVGPVRVDEDLRERDIGQWSGCTTAQITAGWPGQLEAWRGGHLDRPPGGERDAVLRSRVVRGLERAAAGDGTALVVTHGGVIHLVERLLGGASTGVANLGGRWIEEGLVLGLPLPAPAAPGVPASAGRAVTPEL